MSGLRERVGVDMVRIKDNLGQRGGYRDPLDCGTGDEGMAEKGLSCGRKFPAGKVYECYDDGVWIDLCEDCLRKLGLLW